MSISVSSSSAPLASFSTSTELSRLIENASLEFRSSQYKLGCRYRDGNGIDKDEKKAFEWFMKAANQDHADAMNSIGMAYQHGRGIVKDLTKAAEWYKKSAEAGSVTGMCKFAICSSDGEGITKDEKKGFEWYLKAASPPHHHLDAQYQIGICYRDGKGIAKDEVKAIEWLTKSRFLSEKANSALSALQGPASSQSPPPSTVGLQGASTSTPSSTEISQFLKDASPPTNNPVSQYSLGECYRNGKGVEKDDLKSFEWYMKAANQGHAEAMTHVGFAYNNGRGVGKDLTKAAEWYKKSAEAGSVYGMHNYARLLIWSRN